QRLSEERDMESHRQEDADPGGPQPAERPLSEQVGGPKTLGLEDCGGPAGAVLSTCLGYLSDNDPPSPPVTARILGLAYPELDGCLRAAHQPQR
ncbi:hypothetical protein NDU88_010047, partial [Pleurodeles waltl]